MNSFDYIQSKDDTPCRVNAYPRKRRCPPDINLSKWDEEAFISIRTSDRHERVRDSKERSNKLSIETNKRKHIITRLDENQIEYDIVINETPKLGEIRLPIEFPQGLSFYKQGVNPKREIEPFIRGSYAVYWKNKNNKYKTGKLCHIYRPKIIDSRGFWCWGEIDYDGTGLVMTIPENFLKRCRFPVLVDPVIGTSSVGSQHLYNDGGDIYEYSYEMIMPANPYTVPNALNGDCTMHIYSYHRDSEARGYPCLFANSGSNPGTKISSNEEYADLRSPSSSGEWLTADFTVPGNIASGTTVWLAYLPKYYLFPYFDNGGTAKEMDAESLSSPPSSFVTGGWSADQITLSMYFDYISQQNYTRSIANSAGNSDSIIRVYDSIRNNLELNTPSDTVTRCKGMSRGIASLSSQKDLILHRIGLMRLVTSAISVTDSIKRMAGRTVKLITEANILTTLDDLLMKTRKLIENLTTTDVSNRKHQGKRTIDEHPTTTTPISRISNSIRISSANMDAQESIIRRATKFISITGVTEIWDYIIRRKVRSKKEITIISRITTEYEIHSRIS